MKTILFFVLTFVFLSLVISKTVLAEIATKTDWIGLFTEGTSGTSTCGTNGITSCDSKAGTINGTSWGYPSNRDAVTGACAKTPGANPVLTSAGCSNLVPNPLPSSGTYEFRMYAYDQETPDALIARSAPMTVAAAPGPGGGIPCPIQATNPRVINGLISAPDAGSNFGNLNANCVRGDQATFVPFKIPGYNDLRSIYFTQAKSSLTVTKESPLVGNKTQADIPLTGTLNHLYYVTGNLNISNNISGNQTGVIFVDGNLTIGPTPSNKLTTNSASAGLVFVVGGDVNIDTSVTQIDAVIIAGGKIYTAGAGCSLPPPATAGTNSQLIVNGSLISLDSNQPIQFCRKLANNSQAAELINNEPKYLVILRDLYSDTLQKWSEIQ